MNYLIKQKILGYAIVSLIVLTIALFHCDNSAPVTPDSPATEITGATCMHGDIASSDTTPLAGPGLNKVQLKSPDFLAACPTILIRSDAKPFVLCTRMSDRKPVAGLLNKDTGEKEASLVLKAGSLLGGVYAYLDNKDRLVMVDGNQNLNHIKASEKNTLLDSEWELSIDESKSLAAVVEGHCGAPGCDAVVSISAGVYGTIWFVTQKTIVGVYNPATDSIATVQLANDERVDNSFSTTADGNAAVVTNKALYVLKQDHTNQPKVIWRHGYDNGPGRKPGQLSHGSGATPTFFGPGNGIEYVMITDNAADDISLIVRNTQSGNLVCQEKIFTTLDNSGSENSAIGSGNMVIVASTYGYPYPALPEGAGDSIPEEADFPGGMTRVDINGTGSDCNIIWENTVRSAAVPKLSTADNFIYTIERKNPFSNVDTGLLDAHYFTVVDPVTGSILAQSILESGFLVDTLQMAGNIGESGVFWQGNISGVFRIAPE